MRKEFSAYICFRIFVDTPKDICLKRGIERDAQTGKSAEEIAEIWNAWFDEEENYMKRDEPKKRADIVIDGTKPFDEQLM